MKTSVYKILNLNTYYKVLYHSNPSASRVFENYDVSRYEALLHDCFDQRWLFWVDRKSTDSSTIFKIIWSH